MHSNLARNRICYTAPEMIQQKSDVWSLGVSLIEMEEGRNPYDCYCDEELKRVIFRKEPPCLSMNCSEEFNYFVDDCLVKDVVSRASVSELMDVHLISRG